MRKIYFIFLMLTVFACSREGQDEDVVVPEGIRTKGADLVSNDWSFWLYTSCDDPWLVTWKGDVIMEEDTGNHTVYMGEFEERLGYGFGNEFSVTGTINPDKFHEAPLNFRIINFKILFNEIVMGEYGIRLTFYDTDEKKMFSFDILRSEFTPGDWLMSWIDLPDLVLYLPNYPNVTSLDYGLRLEPTCKIEQLKYSGQ